MNSLLVKIALIAVMFHMTFGCSWHHGFGAHACQNQCTSFDCQHGNPPPVEASGCCNHDHDDRGFMFKSDTPVLPIAGLPIAVLPNAGVPCSQHDDHAACHHDHCDLTTVAKYEFTPIDYSTEYMGGAASDSLVTMGRFSRQHIGFSCAPSSHALDRGAGVRTHLLLGVLVI